MTLKLVIENPEKIKLFDPDLQSKLKVYLLQPLLILLFFSPLLYFFGIFHPAYQLTCEKTAYSAVNCRLKSTYYFIVPWYTNLGSVQAAEFQINPSVRRNKSPNSCGEISLVMNTANNPLAYDRKQQNYSFYLNCGNFAELRQIADEINYYINDKNVKQFNLPSLPRTLDQYLWTLGLMAAFLFQSKRIEVSFDKRTEQVTVKTIWIVAWTKTYPLSDVKEILFHQDKEGQRHLIMRLALSRVDLGDISGLQIFEQKQICDAINDFLGLK